MSAIITTVDGRTFEVTGDPERTAQQVMESRTRQRGELLQFTDTFAHRIWVANDRIVTIAE